MEKTVVALATESALEGFVRKTLCERDRLDPARTPLFRTAILRKDVPAGWLYHIEGPRMLHNSAIWAEAENRILFYDSMGKRFHEARLGESPELKRAA